MPRKLPRMQTPVQKAKVEEEQRKMTFSEKYEEELKRQLFEKTQSEVKEDVNDILNANTTIHKPHPDQEWDVPITEEIKYFDSELSYEITGYRPITMDKGLDFKHKEVINIKDGKRLGFVQDVCADLESGMITSIIVPGNNKILNMFSGSNEIVIEWSNIKCIGDDVILVEI